MHPEYVKRVDAIGVSGHMLGCLPMDKDGQTLRPAMIHADTRALAISNALRARFGRDYFYEICGNVLSPASTLCKTLWLKEHEPGALRPDRPDPAVEGLSGLPPDRAYGHDRHVRRLARAADEPAHAAVRSGYVPERRRGRGKIPRDPHELRARGLPVRRSGGCLGLRAGIPVSVGGGDGACANIGAGVAKPGDFYLSLGTTAWIAGQMEEPFIDPPHRVFHIYTLDGHGCNVFGTEQCAGRSVSWAMELFDVASARAFDSAAATVPAGAAASSTCRISRANAPRL